MADYSDKDIGEKAHEVPMGAGHRESEEGEVYDNADHLQRHLGNRQIQLIAIGGSIGTALFVSINSGLFHGGPGSLFLAYALYSFMLAMVNNCTAEMTVHLPVSGGFIRLAGKWVDDAFGFMVRTRGSTGLETKTNSYRPDGTFLFTRPC
jgi:amino acid permease